MHDAIAPPTPFQEALQSASPPVRNVLQFFRYIRGADSDHPLDKPFADLATILATGPQNPETTVALRKLLEAKDAAVRAHLFDAGA